MSLVTSQHGWCLTFKIGLIATHDYDIILLLVKDIRKSTFKSYLLVEEKINNLASLILHFLSKFSSSEELKSAQKKFPKVLQLPFDKVFVFSGTISLLQPA